MWLLGNIRVLSFNGSFYTCYTLPEYDSPYSENETIRLFLQEVPNRAALMIGRQGDYRFNLYLDRKLVHYELLRGGVILVNVTTTNALTQGGQLVIYRTESEITIFHQDTLMGMAIITDEVLSTIRFTDICVGGGFFVIPLFTSSLSNVYYNFYALSDDGETEYKERNVPTISRVNFNATNANITLPGNLAPASAINIDISFRTSQQNAIILHSEDSGNYFRVAISNSQLLTTVSFEGIENTTVCDGLNISMYEWYNVVVEPIIMASDSSSEVGVSILQLTSGQATSACPIRNNVLDMFSAVPLVLGSSAAGDDGLMGCLEVEYNLGSLNLDAVLSDVIVAENCEPCFINPCMNNGTCMNINDYEFNCSCADPFFGRFCG